MAAIFIAATAYGQPSTQPGGAITINDNANASPYPSTVLVTNFVGEISRVTVTLTGITHGYPDDIDIVLRAPNGEQVKLLSDVGGQFDLGGMNLTIDSTASGNLPNETIITTGTFRPTDFDGGDTETGDFAGGTDLGVFIGDNPNGTWRLFVRDDTVVDAGSITGWTLRVFTEPVLSLSTNALVLNEDAQGNVTVFANDSDTPEGGLTFTTFIPVDSTNLIQSATVNAGTAGTNRVITVQARANQTGTGTVEIRVNDGVTTTTTNLAVTVNAVNDRPTIALNTATTQVAQGGISTNVLATVADVDDDAEDLVVTAFSSSNPAVVPASNVFVVGSGTNDAVRHVRFSPAANASPGSATITLHVADPAGGTNTTTIDVTVVAAAHIVRGNPAAITIPTNGTASPYPSTVTVQNVSGQVGEVTVTLLDVNHAQLNDLGVLLVGPQGQEVVLMRGAGGTGAATDLRLHFDDDNAAIPAGALTTSTNGPADNGSGNFPAPATTAPYTTALDSFVGTNPNGNWSLYVYDAEDNTAGGAINGGWQLNIFVAPVVGTIAAVTTPEDTATNVTFTVTDMDGTVTNVTAQVVATPTAVQIVNVSSNLSGTTATLTLTPISNLAGQNLIRVIAQDNQGFTGTNTFTVTVTQVNDLPTMSIIPKQLARAGQSVGPISFNIGDIETPPADLEVRVASNNPKLLPPGSLVLGGSGPTRTLTIFPAGAQGGQADITVTVIDAGGGSTAQTFDLTVEEAAFPLYANETGIVINDTSNPLVSTQATPYPSIISVTNLTSPIADVQVTLFGITHPKPDDLDIMLVHSGSGASVLLMSDVGGGTDKPVNNVTLIFRDSAAGPLGDDAQIVSGSYDPSNVGGSDFPFAGSPGQPTATTFAGAFNGVTPNGEWRLYVVDDEGDTRGGVITSWQLAIRTRPTLPNIADQTTSEDTPHRFTVDIGDAQPGVNYTITTNVTPLAPSPNVVDSMDIQRSGDSLTITINPETDLTGTNQITLTIQDDLGNSASDTFNFIVTPRNDAPRFVDVPNATTPAATPITIPFTVTDVEGSAVTVGGTSSDTTLVPNSAIVVNPATGTATSRTVTITPAGILSGSTTITLTGTDADGAAATETFVLTVSRAVAFENTASIVINDFAAATPYPSVIDVSGVQGSVRNVSVILNGFGHLYPDDVDVLLVSPDNRRVMLMSDAGGSGSVSGRRLTFVSGAPVIPDESTLSSGAFSPANYTDVAEGADVMPSPAPAGPYSTDLGTLDGVNPNGQWRLFVRDDTFQLAGSITGGWTLLFETGPTISTIPLTTTLEDVPAVVRFTIADQDTVATNLIVEAEVTAVGTSDPNLVVATNLVLTGTDENRTLTIIPSTNLSGTNLITVTVTDGETDASTSFAFRVTPVDDPPVFLGFENATNRYVVAEDGSRTFALTVGDIDSSVGRTNITIATSNPTLLTNIVLVGEDNDDGDGVASETITVTPNANQSGTAVLTISLRDQATTVTTNITIDVTPVNDAPTISISTNFVSVVAGQTSGIVNVRVTDIETLPRNLVLSGRSRNQSVIPDANILVGGAETNRTAQFIAVLQTGTADIELIVSDGSATSTNVVTVEVRPAPGAVFANAAGITVRDNNTASPSPSTIVVSGVRGPITRVSLTLDGFTHPAPDDVDILLVHRPSNRQSILMSDAGGRNAVSNLRLTFDELNAPRDLADESPITSGTYSATDYAPADTFTGAPAGTRAVDLNTFNGVANANGEWDLYVVDDTTGDAGQVAFGWAIRIETGPTIVASPNSRTTAEDVAQMFDVAIDDMTTTNALALSFSNSNGSIIQSVTYAPNPITSPDLDVTVTPVPNANGTNVLTITVRNPSGASASTTVTNIFTPVADAPTMSRLVNQSTQEDRPVSFEVLINDVDTPLAGLWLEGVSANTAVISSTNILINGSTNLLKGLPDNIVRITLQPNAGAVGSSQITLNLSEGGTNNLVSSNFVLTVSERNDLPVIVNTNTQPVVIDAGASRTIPIQASDPEGLTTTVTATSSDQALVRNADIVVTPASSTAADRNVTITTQPGVEGSVTITLVAADPGNNRATNTFTVSVRPTRERIFSNRGQIVINDNAAATPYPSTIAVSGLAGSIAKVTVTLHRFYHTFADDTDMLLVSPTGQKVMVWSDVGGDIDVTNITIKLDDAALNALPNNGPLVNGTFRPTNDDTTTDELPSPAPAAPYADTLAAFNGQSPNGTWQLFVRDDTASDSGLIVEGWSLGITTQPVLVGLSNVTSQEDRSVTEDFTVAEESFASTDFTFTGTSSNPALVPNSTNNIVFGGSGTNRTVTLVPVENASGNATITVRLRNADGQEVTGSFVATFTSVNDVPTITQLPNQTVPAGGEITVTNFTYSDVETERSLLVISVGSTNPDVIPTNNVVIVGDEVRISANGDVTGRSTVTITVTDQGGASASTTFEVSVVAGANPIFSNRDGITIRDNNTALPYPSTIVVSNVGGLLAKVTVTVAEFRHTYVDDVDILLVGPGGQSVVLLSDAGTGGDNTPAELENARFIFDDAGALPPDNAALPETGTFRPSNFEGSETFPAPAPAGPYGTALSVFNGTSANGTWSLYVLDDASPDSGSIGSWSLTFTTTAPTITQIPSPVLVDEDTPTSIPFQVNAPNVNPTNLVVNTQIDGAPIISLAITGTGTDRTLTITPRTNQVGSNVVTLTVSDQTGTTAETASTTFTVIVRNVDNDPPVVGTVPAQTADPGETITVTIPVTDPDTALADLVFTAGTDSTNIVEPPILIDLGTNANTIVATITTKPTASGTETVRIRVFDGQNIVDTSFELEVSGNRAPVIADIADVTTNEDVPVTVNLTVTDAETPTAQLIISADAANTNLVSGINITNTGTQVTATINLVPNAFGTSLITVRANDGTNTTTETFTLTVRSVVECPTLGPIADQTGAAGSTIRVPLNVTDPDTAFTDLNFLGGATGTTVVQGLTFERTATTATAVLTLQPNATGSDTVTIRVLEGECPPATQSFTVTIGDVEPGPATLAIARQGTNNIVLTITGDVGATYTLEGSSDLRAWAPVGTVTIGAGGTATVTIPSNRTFQFYRARAGAAPAPAPALVYEGYAYPAGTTISTNENGGTGWAGGWTPDVETPTNAVVLAQGLEYGDGPYALVTSPGSVLYTATTNNMASGDVRGFRTFAGGVQSTGVTWISFIGQRLGPTTVNTNTPANPYPRGVNLSFYEGGTERFAIGNGSGAVSNLWTIVPQGGIGNVTNAQRSAVPFSQQAFIVLRINHDTSGTNDSLYMWVNPPLGSTPDISTASARSENAYNYAIDRIRPFAGGNDTGNGGRPYGELALDEFRVGPTFRSVAPISSDLTAPFNTIVLVTGTDTDTSTNAPPAAEGVERVIDNAGQKYLNFLEFNSGFIVTPLGSTTVNGLRFWTANDAVERDPASYKLEGSNDGTTWTVISEGPLTLPAGRNAGGATTALRSGLNQVVRFTNTTSYSSYRVTFPTVKDATAANSMQIAEVDFFSF